MRFVHSFRTALSKRRIVVRPSSILCAFMGMLLTACSANAKAACSITEPVWAMPPEDAAIPDLPAYGYFFINKDRSIWASAWWEEYDPNYLRVSEDGIKVGWFRPTGAELEITGQRLDASAPSLEAEASCCYPTRFQASGLYFPTEGCWEVTAKAADRKLSFVLWVEP